MAINGVYYVVGHVEEQSPGEWQEYLGAHARVHGHSKVCIVGDSGRYLAPIL
jgi:hypothetical protein